jgi:hypothetical protein
MISRQQECMRREFDSPVQTTTARRRRRTVAPEVDATTTKALYDEATMGTGQ